MERYEDKILKEKTERDRPQEKVDKLSAEFEKLRSSFIPSLQRMDSRCMPSLNICRRADNTCSVSSVKSTIMPTEAISAQRSKKFIIKVYSLPYKVVFQIIILGNFPVLTRCDPCSFFEYLHKAYLISVSAEVGYFLNGHIGGRKIILSCLDLCG